MAVTKISEKFTEKKSKFNSFISNPQIFDCDDFNIIKLFQYAIFREEGFNARPYWKLPIVFLSVILWIKRLRVKNKIAIQKNEKCKIFVGDCERYVLNRENEPVSRYFGNILQSLKKEEIIYVKTNQFNSLLKYDVDIKNVYDYYSVLPLTEDDIRLLKKIKKTYKKVTQNLNLDDSKKKILAEVIEIFWREYRMYRTLLECYPNLKLAFLFPHYQKESLIYALKRRRVKIIELQHGLIANEDMFYVYDKKILKVKEKALFADEMWVYGQYWKDTLLNGYEYDEKQIKIFGYYLYYEKNFSDAFQQEISKIKQKYPFVIFATAQKNLEKHLAEYINFLLQDAYQKNQKFALIIKEHPSATQSTIDFINVAKENVFVMNYPIEWLFQVCDAHFSIYSTTLYDALMFNIQHNFALKHPLFSDYVESIVNKGIAIELLPTENLLDKISASNTTIPPLNVDYFYSPVNFELLKEYTANL
jgi:hypothetical protein